MSLSNPLRGILDANKLTGPNFTDRYRNLRIILTAEKITYVLEEIVLEPSEGASEEDVLQYKKYYDDSTLVQCYMLSSMSFELQRQHESMGALRCCSTSTNYLRSMEGLRDMRYQRVSLGLECMREF